MHILILCSLNHQIFSHSIKEELTFGLKNIGLNEEEINERINQALNVIHLDDVSKDPHSLSYGQRKMLTIATVLAMDPDIILLDEPELGVDIGFISKLKKLILKLNNSGKTFVIISHDLDLIEDLTHRIVFLEEGIIKKEGTTKEIINEVRDYFDQ